MPDQNPSILNAPLVFPRLVGGYRRAVVLDHPLVGIVNILVNEAGWVETNSPVWTNYADTPSFGPKQKALHSRGTKEISWSIGGELTAESLTLLNLMLSTSRGLSFNSILIQQGTTAVQFLNPDGFSLPWTSFSANGAQDANVSFRLEGRSTRLPTPITPITTYSIQSPIPSWFTGNQYVTAWSMSHSVPLAPSWTNTPYPLPTYYRPGESEFSVDVTTAVALQEYDTIRFGLGGVSLLDGLVINRTRNTGDRNSHHVYQVTLTNARTIDSNAFTPTVLVDLQGGPIDANYR
jgi:hypothetical protein